MSTSSNERTRWGPGKRSSKLQAVIIVKANRASGTREMIDIKVGDSRNMATKSALRRK